VVAEYTKLEEEIDRQQKLLQEASRVRPTICRNAYAFQASNYLAGCLGSGWTAKKPIEQVVEQRKLDFELLDRWMKYMAKPTTKYKYKKPGRP
jgi:hypothetical protein